MLIKLGANQRGHIEHKHCWFGVGYTLAAGDRHELGCKGKVSHLQTAVLQLQLPRAVLACVDLPDPAQERYYIMEGHEIPAPAMFAMMTLHMGISMTRMKHRASRALRHFSRPPSLLLRQIPRECPKTRSWQLQLVQLH